MKRYRKAGIVVGLLLLVVLLIGGTYAFIHVTLTGSKRQVITAGNLTLELEEDENNLTITDAFPMYDETGMIQDAFTFRLINNGSININYTLMLVDITTGDKLSTSDVKYGLTKDGETTIALLSTLEDGVIDTGIIRGNQTIHYALRLWIDFGVEENSAIAGKSLSYRIDLEVGQSVAASDIILAASLDGEPLESFPTPEDNYGVESVSCNGNAVGTFKTSNWSFIIEDVTTSETECTVNFSTSLTVEETAPFITSTKEELNEKIVQGKSSIASAITNMGVPTSSEDSFTTMADNIEKISLTPQDLIDYFPTKTVKGVYDSNNRGDISFTSNDIDLSKFHFIEFNYTLVTINRPRAYIVVAGTEYQIAPYAGTFTLAVPVYDIDTTSTISFRLTDAGGGDTTSFLSITLNSISGW